MTDRETLREKAERVNTWGENWSTSFDDRTQVRDVYDRLVASVEGVDEADYIAAADPPTVLALLDDLDRAEAEVKRLREGIRSIHASAGPSQGFFSESGYSERDHCCGTCGEHGEYGVEWPCATVRLLDRGDDQ